jgi:hypothetical protein
MYQLAVPFTFLLTTFGVYVYNNQLDVLFILSLLN